MDNCEGPLRANGIQISIWLNRDELQTQVRVPLLGPDDFAGTLSSRTS
jgi:hypothetical protein